ncbi:hypothetical protein [Streptomyces hydrogenans]|uniref:hypothetical protein n=1 Tax=Streptomyces hydrogenans TaxID=1873719 RepID=UPI00380449C9
MSAICAYTTGKNAEACQTAPGFIVSDEKGSVVHCCGYHIGTATSEADVVYTVIRTTHDTAALLLGRLVNRTGAASS